MAVKPAFHRRGPGRRPAARMTWARLVEPVRYARVGGALYLVIIVAGIVGPLLTRERLVVPGNATATADNIAASPELWRIGIAADVVMQLCDVPVMLILFLLLSPVNKNVALLALLFNIIQTATLVANQQTLIAAQLASADQPAFDPASQGLLEPRHGRCLRLQFVRVVDQDRSGAT